MPSQPRIEPEVAPNLRTRQTLRSPVARLISISLVVLAVTMAGNLETAQGQPTLAPTPDEMFDGTVANATGKLRSDFRVRAYNGQPQSSASVLERSERRYDVATELYDRLNAAPTKWFLESSDCDAKVIEQTHVHDGGIDGRPCESVQFVAGQGTEALFVYPIEPVMAIDSLTASLAVTSPKTGARIGLRVRYPHLRNRVNQRLESVVIYGATYEHAGKYRRIGVGSIERLLRLQSASLRQEHGLRANLKDSFVDAIVVNGYSGAGTTSVRFDELRVQGMIPVTLQTRMGIKPAGSGATPGPQLLIDQNLVLGGSTLVPNSNRVVSRTSPDDPSSASTMRLSMTRRRAFARNHITKIFQYNGEPLSHLRTLGFDAVLLNSPPTIELLREARSSRLLIYAPPPSAPDPAMEPYLEPVAGWYLGSGQAVDAAQRDEIESQSRLVRRWPLIWQRPIVLTPLEDVDGYTVLADAIVQDFPAPTRRLGGGNEVASLKQAERKVRRRNELAVGVISMPQESLLRQCEAIASGIGAPPVPSFNWHSMLRQAMEGLEQRPDAILFRSTRSLVTGTELATQRSSALSYCNRLITALTPWVLGTESTSVPPISGVAYRGAKLQRDGSDLLLLTTGMTRGSESLAGDGATLALDLAPQDAAKTFWRVTHFSAERLTANVSTTGVELQIVSPDVVEIIVGSSDPTTGARLAASFARFAEQASQDRLQLVQQAVRQTRVDLDLATATGVTSPSAQQLLQLAERTIDDSQPMILSGQRDEWFRQARRADAWALRSRWQLCEALMPNWPEPTSSPPVDLGALSTQTIWRPLMDETGWGVNRLTSGGLDSPELLSAGRWAVGHRLQGVARSEVSISTRSAFSGAGALKATSTSLGGTELPGGYAGTVVQIRSPGVTIPAGTAIRIDAMVRTIGFGGPHQGLLMHDSVGGQAMGLLLRGKSTWTPVRMYRQTLVEGNVQVLFEIIGAGEALIDDVQISLWEPRREPPTPIPMRPITNASL